MAYVILTAPFFFGFLVAAGIPTVGDRCAPCRTAAHPAQMMCRLDPEIPVENRTIVSQEAKSEVSMLRVQVRIYGTQFETAQKISGLSERSRAIHQVAEPLSLAQETAANRCLDFRQQVAKVCDSSCECLHCSELADLESRWRAQAKSMQELAQSNREVAEATAQRPLQFIGTDHTSTTLHPERGVNCFSYKDCMLLRPGSRNIEDRRDK
ncbi:MAG: hypothetical protein AB7G93_11010 [Bdellovibrionales bacterium]